MSLKLFETLEQFMMDTFLLKFAQFEKTGSIGETFRRKNTGIIYRRKRPAETIARTDLTKNAQKSLEYEQKMEAMSAFNEKKN